MGDIYITTLSTNPATRFLGTTWEKIEGRFLLSTSGSNASGQTGGSNTKTIAKANLPNVKLQVDSFSLGKGTQEITGILGACIADGNLGQENGKDNAQGAFTRNSTYDSAARVGNTNWTSKGVDFKASRTWAGLSTSASPYTSALGSGTPLDITPSFYTVHIWKRLS